MADETIQKPIRFYCYIIRPILRRLKYQNFLDITVESRLSVTNTCPWLLDDVFFCMPISGNRSEAAIKNFCQYLNNILDIEEKRESITNPVIFIVLQD